MTATDTSKRSPRWGWIAAIWCAGGLFDASQSVFIQHAEGKYGGELRLFVTELATWLPWVLATPLLVGLARRFPIVRRPTARAIAAHLTAFIVISATSEVWSAALQVMFNPWGARLPLTFWQVWSTTLIFQALTFLIVYALILTITYVVDSRENIARQMTEAARLNEELSKAQLAALRQQIEPHFMFNTLNSIAGLVRDDRNQAAVSMIVGLSEFLRRATEDSHRSQVTLAEEVEYLERYLGIQKLRFGDRLRVSMDIPANLLGAEVPNLLLQPLVENAIKHGITKRVAGGRVRVTGARRNGSLWLSVYNDGPKFPDDWQSSGTGVGLANLRMRLKILHGEAHELIMRRSGTKGVEVIVSLPLGEA